MSPSGEVSPLFVWRGMLMWPHISPVSGSLRAQVSPGQHPARPGPGHQASHLVTIRGWESVIIIVSAPGHHGPLMTMMMLNAYLKLMPGFPPGQEVIVVTNFHV